MAYNDKVANNLGMTALIARMRQLDGELAEVSLRGQDLKFDAEGLLLAGRRVNLDQQDRNRLFKKVDAPLWYLEKHGAQFQATALSEHFNRGDFGRTPKLILRDGEFHTITRGDLNDLPSATVLSAVGEALRKEGESLLVSRVDRNDERVEVELVSTSKAIAVRPGDIVQAGLHIIHAPYGNEATIIEAFTYRLVCTNGMTRRECVSRDGIVRTRKLAVDYPNGREIQLSQIRRLASQNWNGLQSQLEALRATSERPANVEELLNSLLRRARISPQSMMPRLLAAWQAEGSENSRYAAVNALTRVATHDAELSARQRRVLSALGGLLAFSAIHLCDKCYSLLTTLRGGADESETNVPDRHNSATDLSGDRNEREVEA
jgi:hypothetical protein